MNFTRRYLFWLLLPPALVSLPPALLFVSQVVQMSAGRALGMLALLVVAYLGGCVQFALGVRPLAGAVEAALEGYGDLPSTASRLLERTIFLSILLWVGGGALFAVVATYFFMPTVLGFAYFLVAALIAAFPSVVWGYAMGKHRIVEAAGAARLRYNGRELSLGRKIAVVFIGALAISTAALILLISSKVSTTLEQLAIDSASERFERLHDSANLLARVDAKALDTLRDYIPNEYALHHITADGKVASTKEPLEADEVASIRRMRNGDSSSFVGSHVSRFAELKDGSILVMSVPWTPYQHIPRQIAFYTILITLLTMMVFGAATYVLARDVTKPLRELRSLARQMAEGNFEADARVFADDEVGQLAESFGETRANLSRLLGRVGGSGSTITEGVRVITGGTEMLLLRSRDQSDLTESSSIAVENVRTGIRTVLEASSTVSELTQDASSRALELQASAEQVASSMDYLFQSVEKTSSSTTEMHASMSETSRRAQVLAGISEEVLSFVSEMDATVGELRSSSESTAEIAQQVRVDAQAGADAVNRTVEGINSAHEKTMSAAQTLEELQQSVGKITQILTVIEEVANRTNLLSLNAAIIAAQAGEHGTGFSIVADEIRELAERTRGSTKEIGSIIKAVQNGSRQAVAKMHEGVAMVADNVELAHDAASTLTKIMGSAAQSFEMATKISSGLEEQSRASSRLHEATSRMSDHIAEINRATGEQARGTQLLAQEAERVRDIAALVKHATEEQSSAGRGISTALERIADDARTIRDLLELQLEETDRIADATRDMLEIAQKNDSMAREFNATVQSLVRSGSEFESEVSKFRYGTAQPAPS